MIGSRVSEEVLDGFTSGSSKIRTDLDFILDGRSPRLGASLEAFT